MDCQKASSYKGKALNLLTVIFLELHKMLDNGAPHSLFMGVANSRSLLLKIVKLSQDRYLLTSAQFHIISDLATAKS